MFDNVGKGENTTNSCDWRNRLADLRGAYSENTIRAYSTGFRKFAEWCARVGQVPLPASPDTVAAFVEAMSMEWTPATIENRLAAIARVHRMLGHASPTDTETVKLAFRRITRAKGTRQRQAAGLSADLKERLLSACSRIPSWRARPGTDRRRLRYALPPLGAGEVACGGYLGPPRRRRQHPDPPIKDRSSRRGPACVSVEGDDGLRSRLARRQRDRVRAPLSGCSRLRRCA